MRQQSVSDRRFHKMMALAVSALVVAYVAVVWLLFVPHHRTTALLKPQPVTVTR